MAEVASAFVSLMPSARGFGKELNSQVGGEIKKSGSKMGGLLGKSLKVGALGVAGVAGAAIGTALFKGFGRLQGIDQAEAKLKGLGHTTKSVDTIMSNALTSVKGTAFGLEEAATTAATAVAAGIEPGKQLADYLTLVGDAATISGVSMAEMGRVMNKARTLGGAYNDTLQTLAERGLPVYSLLSKEVGVSTSEIKKLASEGKISSEILESALRNNVGGAALDSGKTFAGSMANMRAALGRLGASVLGGVFAEMPTLFGKATGALDDLGPIAERAGEFIGDLVPKLQEMASIGWGKLTSGVEAIRNIGNVDLANLDGEKLGRQIGTAISSALGALGKMTGQLTSKLGELFAKVDWVGIGITMGKQVPALLIGLAAGILAFDLGSLLSGLAEHWSTILIGIVSIAFAPAKLLAPLVKVLGKIPFVGTFLARAVTWFNGIGRAFGSRVVGFMRDLGRMFTQGFGKLKIPGAGLVRSVLGAFKAIPGRVANFFKTLQTRIGVWALDAFEAMGRGARTATGLLLRFVTFIPRQILKALGSLARTLSPRGSELIGGFRTAIAERFAVVASFVKAIPSKVVSAVGDLGQTLYGAGQRLIQGLIDGIRSMFGAAGNAMSELGSKLKGYLPGSPIKWGPLKSWNGGGAGKRLMDLVTLGITKGTPKTIAAAQTAFGKIGDALKSERSNLQGTLDGLKSDFASLADSVSKAFTGDLFSVTATEAVAASRGVMAVAARSVGQNFIDNLLAKRGELTGLMSSFKTLVGWGLDPKFLSQLFASGQGALITEIAGMGQAGAVGVGSLFGEVNSLGAQLGNAVAANDPVSSRLDETNRLLARVDKGIAHLSGDIGKELNGVAAKAQRDKKSKKGKR